MTTNINASLSGLATFGDVAAEDDAVLDYFLKTDAVARIQESKAYLVLGRKGAGKTAIVRYFVEGKSSTVSKTLNLRGYPWNVHAARIDHGASEVEAYVSSWRYLIAVQFASLVLKTIGDCNHAKSKLLQKFLHENYGGIEPELGNILRPAKIKLSKTSFEPEAFGFKLGSVDLERRKGDLQFGAELNALSDLITSAVVEVATSHGMPNVLLHFDELDQGLTEMTEDRERMLIGLILAARALRSFCQNHGSKIPISAIVYLRTDLWDDLKFSDKNKITETHAMNIKWDSDALLDVINMRLASRLGEGVDWNDIATPELMRGSQTKWKNIVARTFLRPRDVIKFLNSALSKAKLRSDEPLQFKNEDITSAREEYSSYLKIELDDEIPAHWPYWEEALQACSAISTLTFQKSQFLLEYDRRKSKNNIVGPDEALKLLYRFSVIGYKTPTSYGGSSWAFQYTNPEAGWDNGATTFKVHLGLKEFAKLREERNN